MTPSERLKEGIRLASEDLLSRFGELRLINPNQAMQIMRERGYRVDTSESGMDKLTEANVQEQTKQMSEFDKMQADYNDVCESLREQVRKNGELIAEKNKLFFQVQDQRENLAAARKLRKRHERQIKLLQAELDAARAWKDLERAKLVQLTVNNKVSRLADESMELNARFEEIKKRYEFSDVSEQG